jgi:hypothetical protein
MRVIRPISGFGPWGWALLPIAVFLTYCICGGYDLRFGVMQWWSDRFGWQSMLVTMIDWTIFPQSFSAWGPVCNVVTLIPVLVAMHLQPRSYPRWVWPALVLWCLVNPLLWWNWHKIGFGLVRSDALDMYVAVQLAIFACVVAWLMGSLRVGLVVLLVGGAVAILNRFLNSASRSRSFAEWMNWCCYGGAAFWHVGLAAVLVGSSMVRYRRALREQWRCAGCGYDLRGLGADVIVCPECARRSSP